jgi:hypothetical protein
MLFALAVASVAAYALPAAAMAEDIPVHLVPKPTGARPITGGASVLTTVNNETVSCKKVSGNATFETGTTGTLALTFEQECKGKIGGIEAACANIATTGSFHLLTVPTSQPGVLITPPASGVFAEFKCAGILNFKVTGNGVIGTITAPKCGAEAESATLKFEGAAGVQKHKLVEGTTTKYNLLTNGKESAIAAEGTVALGGKTLLECT